MNKLLIARVVVCFSGAANANVRCCLSYLHRLSMLGGIMIIRQYALQALDSKLQGK